MRNDNEFQTAFEQLINCKATLKCGCNLSEDENWYAEVLNRQCFAYMQAYADYKENR